MDFEEFVSLTRPVIGGKSSSHKFVRTLFDAILTEDAGDVLEGYSVNTYKAYANGRTKITEIAKAIGPYVDPAEFIAFIAEFPEATQLELCNRFDIYIPNLDARNVADEIADLFAGIIRDAAGTKRKSTPKGVDSGESTAHEKLEEKIFASGNAVADAWKKSIDSLAGSEESLKLNEDALVDTDKVLLDKFRKQTDEILHYCIENDPSAGATRITLSDEIHDVCRAWNLELRKIKNKAFRQLVIDTVKVLEEYTYYLSDKFLRWIPETETLWFRNESWEEGQQLRDVLQPESYKKRCEIRDIYLRLYPIPEDEHVSEDDVEAEVVDDEMPSGAADEDKKTTIIQHQTNVIQNGENNFNLTNNGTMNFNL